MRAMLVAAGLGTRLAPLTDLLPKPAVPVANRAVAAYMMEHLAAHGIREMVANSFHLAARLEATLEGQVPKGVHLTFARERVLLGTGGGIKNALRPQPGEDFLVANAKVLFAPDIHAAITKHAQSGALATMVLKPMPVGARFGAIDIDSESRVQRILDPGLSPAAGLRRCMFTGVHILSAEAHRRLPDSGCAIREGYLRWLMEGAYIASVLDDSPFIDVGQTVADYYAANMGLCSGALVWPSVRANADHSVLHATASIGQGARVLASAVGEDAQIAAGVLIERSVVWPHSRVDCDTSACIVTPKHVIDCSTILSSHPSSGTEPL